MNKTPEEITSDLIDQFIVLRKEHGLSHEQLAKKAGLSRAAISFIENDKRTPTILTCLKICEALEINMHELLEAIE